MTRRSSAALALALVLLVAACGGGDDSSSGSGDQDPTDDASGDASGDASDGGNGDDANGDGDGDGDDDGGAVPDLSDLCPVGAIDEAGGPVEITYWHSMTEANQDALEALTDEFNASQSEVSVRLVNQISYDDTLTAYTAALGGGDLPDLVQVEDKAQQLMLDSRSVVPAQACVDAGAIDLSAILPKVVEYYTIDGVLGAVPFNVSNPVLYYNRNTFEAAGLDPDDPPTTLAELEAAAAQVVETGASATGYAFKIEPWYLEQWLAMGGELFVDNDNGRSDRASETVFDSPLGLEIFETLDRMVDDGSAITTGRTGFDNLLAIANDQAAMTVDTSAALGTIVEVLAAGDFPNVDLGVSALPGPAGAGGVIVGGGANFVVVHSEPAEQEAAMRFAEFLASSSAEWHVATGYLPITEEAAASDIVLARWAETPEFQVPYEQLLAGELNTASAGPVIGDANSVRAAVVDAFESMFTLGTEPAAALADAKAQGDAAIDGYESRLG